MRSICWVAGLGSKIAERTDRFRYSQPIEPTTLEEGVLSFAKRVNCRECLIVGRGHCRGERDAPQFILKAGAVMEDSSIVLDKWLMAVWIAK
jgi:hypothetical protein